MKYEYRAGSTAEVREQFLKLPRRLYDKSTYVQDIKLEEQLLTGSHVLSCHFKFTPIIVLERQKAVVGRCILTFYEDDPAAYVGFFECIDDSEAATVLFQAAETIAREQGKTRLTGPLNGSFWIGYRLKVDRFETVYTSEPYNKEYYSRLWKQAGFVVCDRYSSNLFRVPRKEDSSMKCRQRLQMIREKGYEILSPNRKTFDVRLKEIYGLLIRVYANFPMFKRIEEQEFCELFKGLKHVLDFELVKLVYWKRELVGFFICVPNYGNLTHQSITPGNLLKILRIKYRRSKEYVLLYMGIDPGHPGLGAAMAELIKQELTKRRARSIGALIHEEKISGEYYKELTMDRCEYVLFEKEIETIG